MRVPVVLLSLGCLLAGVGCESPAPAPARTTPPPAVPTTTSAPTAPSTPVQPSTNAAACPTTYAAPDPHRPVVRLEFALSGDRREVIGREQLTFRPDLPISDVVFRLWPNAPRPAAHGSRLTVTAVSVDGMASHGLEQQDTLLRVRLAARRPAGSSLHADLRFTLRLPVGADDRLGVRDGVAWLGSAYPLLAWVRGRGWATEPATALFAEAATSEDFRLADLAVTAPAGDTVLAVGRQVGHSGRTWHFTADAVRDVAVASGRFRLARATGAGGVPVTVGVAPGLADDPAQVAAVAAAAIAPHVRRFGPFPYPTLAVPVVPDLRGGVEYPGLFFLGSHQLDATPSHEIAHQWFYGLVGDDQARDPWLDEAFATYAEALARGTAARYRSLPIPTAGRGRVGAPMTYWEPRPAAYFRSVYVQGAVALLAARQAAGAAAFDRALRCYVAREAHQVARPADLATVLGDGVAGLPAAVGALRAAGALPSSR